MQMGRGCFGICTKDGFVYAFGGVTGKDFIQKTQNEFNHIIQKEGFADGELIPSCEKYDIDDD